MGCLTLKISLPMAFQGPGVGLRSGGRGLTCHLSSSNQEVNRSAQSIPLSTLQALEQVAHKIMTAASPAPCPRLSCSDPKKIYSSATKQFPGSSSGLSGCQLHPTGHASACWQAQSQAAERRPSPQQVSECWRLISPKLRGASALLPYTPSRRPI